MICDNKRDDKHDDKRDDKRDDKKYIKDLYIRVSNVSSGSATAIK